MSDNGEAGTRDWYRDALNRYEGPLTRYAQRITGDFERARDVVQETFLRLCSHGKEKVDGHLAEWLFTVCRNQAIDSRRKERRMTLLAANSVECSPTRIPTPEVAAETNDAAKRVLKLLEGLSANQQAVIRLKFQSGLSYREISEVTGLTVSNVGFLLHRGLKTIRERITSAGLEGD
jgi:RNA polymerase sigma factor (sigma-70 family)